MLNVCMKYIWLLFLLLLLPFEAHARPISYPGGWTLMTHNNGDSNHTHIHYSPTAKYSLGVSVEYLREEKQRNFNLQWNQLLFRRNTAKSQANLYLKTEAGVASGTVTRGPRKLVPNPH